MTATWLVALLVVCLSHRATCFNGLPSSCADILSQGSSDSGDYDIDAGNGQMTVYCDMSGDEPISIVHHDHEYADREDRKVDNCEEPGSFSAEITYTVSLEKVVALADISEYCEQYISYISHGSVLTWFQENLPYGWWENRFHKKMKNWGGAATGTIGCGCSVSPQGCKEGRQCNADWNIHQDIEDSGFLRDKLSLPVTRLRFGDTGTLDDDEYGFYELGPLRCKGGPTTKEKEIPIIKTNTDYHYRYDLRPLESGECRVEFEVAANNDVFLGFSETKDEQSDLIELNIAGWGNSRTVFRECKQCKPQANWREKGLVSKNEMRGFWVEWCDGCFRLGRAGEKQSLTWCPPRIKDWRYVAFTTGYGSTGKFKFSSFYAKVQHTCEMESTHINCGSKHINIIDANYGRTSRDICVSDYMKSTQCRSTKSRSVVGNLCHGEHECHLAVNNGAFGDPCSSTSKYLKVIYQCLPERVEKYFLPEVCLDHQCNPRGGECIPISGSEYRCACRAGFHGTHCEKEFALCRAWGDPHYTQFSGRSFNYQGKCKYILAKPCVEDGERTFKIVGVNVAPDWNNRVSYNRQLEVMIGKTELFLLQNNQVLIDNNINNLPCSVGDDITIDLDGKYVVVNSESYGMKIMWDGRETFKLFVDKDMYSENMCGLCGSLKPHKDGIFIMKSGSETKDIIAFGDSWTANPFECPSCDNCVDLDYCNEDEKLMQRVEAACEPIRNAKGVFAVGHRQFDPAEMYRTCIYDLCSRKDFDDKLRCNMMTEYANRILVENRLRYLQEGNAIISWREVLDCPFDCPQGSTYTICASACQPTCFQPMAPAMCQLSCVEGCDLPAGYVMENGKPVPENKCGCRYGDKYYNRDQSWLNHDCTLSCTCESGGQAVCTAVSCSEHASCCSRNQVHGCHCDANYVGVGTSRCQLICPSSMGNEIKLREHKDEGHHAIIDLSQRVACEGYIRSFTIKRHADSIEPVTLIVWRRTEEKSKFVIVGSARLSIADDSMDLCTCANSKIPVRVGDYIGFMSAGGTVYYDDVTDEAGGQILSAPYFDSIEPLTEVQFQPMQGSRAYSINVFLESSEGHRVEAFMFSSYLGVQSREISDSAMTASSSLGSYEAHRGRLDNTEYGACSWTAGSYDTDQWLQVDLGQNTLVIGVVTQGHCGIVDQDRSPVGCVKQFNVQYSHDGQNFEYATDDNGKADVFESNCRCQKHIKNFFRDALMTRFIRFRPLLWKRAISMRVDVIGRDVEVDEPDVGGTDTPEEAEEEDIAVVFTGKPFTRCGYLKGLQYRPFNGESFMMAVLRKTDPDNPDADKTFKLIGSAYVTTTGNDRLQRFEVAGENERIPVRRGDLLCLIFQKLAIGYSPGDKPAADVLTTSLGLDEYRAIMLNSEITFTNSLRRRYNGVKPIIQVATTMTIPPVMSMVGLGVEDGQIKDDQVTASSFCDSHSKAVRARLGLKDQQGMTGGWCAREVDQSAYLQINFNKKRKCGGVVTQGLSSTTRLWYVQKYVVRCSVDLVTWQDITDKAGDTVMFSGNYDQETEVSNYFATIWMCKAIRVVPMIWMGDFPAMRLDVLGLPDVSNVEQEIGFTCIHRQYQGSGGFTFVMPDKKFPSDGFVTGIRFMAVRRGSLRVIIFRPIDQEAKKYKIVGRRYIKIKKADVEVEVKFKQHKKRRKQKKWITVKKGDMLGLSFTRSVLYKGIDSNDVTDVVYSRNVQISNFRKLRSGRAITFSAVAKRSYSIVALFKAKEPSLCVPPVDAQNPLGLENGQFPSDSITTSSVYVSNQPDQDFGPNSCRLNLVGSHNGAWVAAKDDDKPWIQVDAGSVSVFTGLVTQGRHGLLNWWTTKYQVATSHNEEKWQDVLDCNNRQTFDANTDSDTEVTRFFGSAYNGQYLRINLLEWVGRPALRFEVLGEFETAVTEYGPSCIDREFIDNQNYILLAAGMLFQSNGYITEWNFFPKNDHAFKAGVWRVDPEDPTRYMHVGSSDIPGHTPNELATYRLDSLARIPFRKGDVMGWSFSEPVICYDEGEESVELLYSGNGGNLEPTPVGQYRKFVSSGKQAYSIGASVSISSVESVPAIACRYGLGMDDDLIPDQSIQTSSVLGPDYGNSQSRLNAEPTATMKGCWAPAQNNKDQYVQVDLGKPTVVTGVSVQGCSGEERWVTKFRVELSLDEQNWKEAQNMQDGRVFYGNTDSDTVVQVFFKREFKVQFIRIFIEEWNNNIGLRFDVLGCLTSCKAEWGVNPLVRKWEHSQCDRTFVVNTQHPLNCNSYIKGWRMVPKNKAPVTFYVLKPIDTEKGKFGVVGKTFVPRRKKLNRGEVYEVLLDRKDWIEVRSGHMIGFTSRGRSPIFRHKRAHDRAVHLVTRNKHIRGCNRLDVGDKLHMKHNKKRLASYSFTAILTQEGVGEDKGTVPPISCAGGIGMENRAIPDDSITVSSSTDVLNNGGAAARLMGDAAWIAESLDLLPCIQVDFGYLAKVTGVTTQGDPNNPNWVTSYALEYSDSFNFLTKEPQNFQWVKFKNAIKDSFPGNTDQNTVKSHFFKEEIEANVVRLWIEDFHNQAALRLEFLGCPDSDPCKPNPCQNGALCRKSQASLGYTCSCPMQWGGKNCEIRTRKCCAYGDPHYCNFDGKKFNFQGHCKYILARTLTTSALDHFEISADNIQSPRRRTVSSTREVYVRIGDLNFDFKRNREVFVNNERISCPYESDGITVVDGGNNRVVLRTEFGLTVSWDGRNKVDIFLTEDYKEEVEGLCGNFNGKQGDDFIIRSTKEQTKDLRKFGESWGADPSCKACEDCQETDQCRLSGRLNEAQEACNILNNRKGPFAMCIEGLDPLDYYENCLYDYCAMYPSQDNLCEDIQRYADDCTEKGLNPGNWRLPGFCELKCPINMVFSQIGTACPDTCGNQDASKDCTGQAEPMCVCMPGLFLEGGDRCVEDAQCGCTYEGKYREINTEFMSEECNQKCACDSEHNVVCEESGCHERAECRVEDGVRGCYCNEGWTGDGINSCEEILERVELVVCENELLELDCSAQGERIEILEVAYGTQPRDECAQTADNADVKDFRYAKTIIRNRCHNQASCSVSVSSLVFGTFAGDTPKALYVVYQCREEVAVGICHPDVELIACQGSSLEIQCGDLKADIIHAAFGRRQGDHNCQTDDSVALTQDCFAPSALFKMVKACHLQSMCTIDAIPDTFGSDPCPNIDKYLRIHYRCEESPDPRELEENKCDPSPCIHGTCEAISIEPKYNCKCDTGYTGQHCDIGEATCTALGDPHYITFDGYKYSFMGACKYTLVKNADAEVPDFEVIVYNEAARRNPRMSSTVQVEFHFNGRVINLKYGGKTLIDNMQSEGLDEPGLKVSVNYPDVVIETDVGIVIRWDGKFMVEVDVTGEYYGHTEGLCGPYDGDPFNDFLTRFGETLDNTTANIVPFARSWNIPKSGCEDCEDCELPDPCDDAGVKDAAQEICFDIINEDGPFIACHEMVSPSFYYQSCVMDRCTMPDGLAHCDDYQAYAEECRKYNIIISWRRQDFCFIDCLARNMIYNPLSPACPTTCANPLASSTCNEADREDCVCPPGMMKEGETCIDEEKCGCTDKETGFYYKQGESFMSPDCNRVCHCPTADNLICTQYKCPLHEVCGTRDNAPACECEEGYFRDTELNSCHAIPIPQILVRSQLQLECSNIDCGAGFIDILEASFGPRVDEVCLESDALDTCQSPVTLPVLRNLCQGRGQCQLDTTSIQAFGEPCFGELNYLFVRFACTHKPMAHEVVPKPFTVRVCQDRSLALACSLNQGIVIDEVFFGRRAGDDYCLGDEGAPAADQSDLSALEKARNQCRSLQPFCSLRGPDFGDPIQETKEYLEITYRCIQTNSQR
ncbi:uncharacterized protein LOC110987964 [Acanthaster planci]|uniref:Uncharacterized protein LOC110987964 n=1 Tax=Acanthaster planci TaxID=133434 RepID=A0A8B7ZTM4_ACAPL|nr:uncharacterized protein LOC110987964 [Acanthaster planci]